MNERKPVVKYIFFIKGISQEDVYLRNVTVKDPWKHNSNDEIVKFYS